MTKRDGRKWRKATKVEKPALRATERRKKRTAALDAPEALQGLTGAPSPAPTRYEARSPFRKQLAEQRAHRQTLKEQRRREYNGSNDTLKLLQTTMGVVARSQKSLKDVYLDGGPTPGTLARWQKKMVKKPGLMTVLGALQACGNLRIAIIDEDGQIVS